MSARRSGAKVVFNVAVEVTIDENVSGQVSITDYREMLLEMASRELRRVLAESGAKVIGEPQATKLSLEFA